MADFCIAAFQCPSDAALAQQHLLACNLKAAMMPTPRGVTVSCGLSLRFAPEDVQTITKHLMGLFPEPERCRYFKISSENGQRTIHPIACTNMDG